MTANLRKGWCPGALRPMMARDGLLVRLRITGGIGSAQLARALAGLAQRHGNGLFDLSARANLQLRGVGENALPALRDELDALGLLDASAEGESVRNVLSSPMAGLGDRLDIRPLVRELEGRLADDETLHRLPPKFGFLVDDGGQPTLANVPADIRFDWIADARAFAIGLGGTRHGAVAAGICDSADMVSRAVDLARAVVALQPSGEPLRMRALLRGPGRNRLLELFGLEPASRYRKPVGDDEVVGIHGFGDFPTLGVAAVFGRFDAAMLLGIADRSECDGIGQLRLTPWRTILLPLRPSDAMERPCGNGVGVTSHDFSRLTRLGLILDPADPRLGVAACTGQSGCGRGTTPTHEDAAALAALGPVRDGNVWLHVSGCQKGCAKASPTALTLVGRGGRYDLVRNGRATDAPSLTGLDLDGVRAALHMRQAEAP